MKKDHDRYAYNTFPISNCEPTLFLYAREFMKEPKETRYHTILYDKIDFVFEWDELKIKFYVRL